MKKLIAIATVVASASAMADNHQMVPAAGFAPMSPMPAYGYNPYYGNGSNFGPFNGMSNFGPF